MGPCRGDNLHSRSADRRGLCVRRRAAQSCVRRRRRAGADRPVVEGRLGEPGLGWRRSQLLAVVHSAPSPKPGGLPVVAHERSQPPGADRLRVLVLLRARTPRHRRPESRHPPARARRHRRRGPPAPRPLRLQRQLRRVCHRLPRTALRSESIDAPLTPPNLSTLQQTWEVPMAVRVAIGRYVAADQADPRGVGAHAVAHPP